MTLEPAHPTGARPARVAVVGGGPAGLMAAETVAAAGVGVDVYDAMPSVGRKFLLAGKGGLNLTHSEPHALFVGRYAGGRVEVARWLENFGPDALREWATRLGIDTFIGSSGRVFPRDMKAAPLLRAWLLRLRQQGVRFHTRHRWIGDEGMARRKLRFDFREAEVRVDAEAVILALGGGSWPRLGSDGAWQPWLRAEGVEIAPLRPSNCGFDVAPTVAALARTNSREPRPGAQAGQTGTVQRRPSASTAEAGACAATSRSGGWSDHFRDRYAGAPVKTVGLQVGEREAPSFSRRGEFVITAVGVEGSLVYAASGPISEALAGPGAAVVHLDLLPDRPVDFIERELARPRGPRSLATHLKARLGLDGVKAGLLHELLARSAFADPAALALAIKALPLPIAAARPLAEAISSAGGVRFAALTEGLMLRRLPGVFCAGEMLDWDAPTGGYLLTACMASGVVAGRGALAHLGVESTCSRLD